MVKLPGLRHVRLLAALTQEQLAEKANVQRGTINRLERGKDCHPTTVRKLADALGVTPKELMEPE